MAHENELMTAQEPAAPLGLVGNPSIGSALKALILRELLTRFGNLRYGWIFVLLEPIVHIAFMAVLFGLILGRRMPGADYVYFITLGILGFEIVMKSIKSGLAAIPANAGLFVHRQVLPVTVILTRVMIEVGLLLISGCIVWGGFTLAGHPIVPHDPFRTLLILLLLTLLGLGWALALGILNSFYPVIDKIFFFVNRPLYFFSGIFFSVRAIPRQYGDLVLWNPVFVGNELMRAYVLGNYETGGLSLSYLFSWAFFSVLIGFSINRLYGSKVVAI
jgi:capsular polysaccharide transport system permease protein